ncbi:MULTISPECIES: hypothetical protein [Burkholderia]|uniref:Uncharacterized protein n=1 Tax=Burkholderia aenigmatica TaxID=2015348 RepID=A0A6J5JLJ4_9BURK|nr:MULTISPECIES: hypothetical protein [Burkholderia]CAB3972298.1 hypothetical protein BLA3211_06898 [Burkholderia aenigmatica]
MKAFVITMFGLSAINVYGTYKGSLSGGKAKVALVIDLAVCLWAVMLIVGSQA